MANVENISTDESADEEEVLRDFDAEAQIIIRQDLLPRKSCDRYLLVYDTFKKWEEEHKNLLSSSTENNLIVYFKEIQVKLKPPTLWSIWSMLKKTLAIHDGIDINRFQNLKSFLSNNCKGYKPKKSSILKSAEVDNFLQNADDYTHLASKVCPRLFFIYVCQYLQFQCDTFFITFLGHSGVWNMWSSQMR